MSNSEAKSTGTEISKPPSAISPVEQSIDEVLAKLVKPSPKSQTGSDPAFQYFVEAARQIQQGLVVVLNSLDHSDYEAMVSRANGVFGILSNLPTDCLPFYERVEAFIRCSVSLTRMQVGGSPYEELHSKYEEKKARFDEVARVHSEASASLSKAQERTSYLENEAASVRKRLHELEAELSSSKTAVSSLHASFDKVSHDLSNSETDMTVALQALELSKKVKTDYEVAKQAFDDAKTNLDGF